MALAEGGGRRRNTQVPSKWQQVASNAECETRYSCNTDGTSCACMAAAQAPVPVALCALAALLPARMRLRDTYAVAKSAENFGGIATMSCVVWCCATLVSVSLPVVRVRRAAVLSYLDGL